jgi:hypothetical protein
MLDKFITSLVIFYAFAFVALSVANIYQDFKKDEYKIQYQCNNMTSTLYISRNVSLTCE